MPALSIPTRAIGKNGPQVPAIGFGLMGLSAFYGKPESDEERFKVLDHAYKIGARNWDSADIYGDNEDLIGKWFKNTGHRNDIFLATKFAGKFTATGASYDSSPEYAKEACAKSLKRLGIDSIDLYYCHRMDGKTPIEKTVQAMVELKNEGKIKHIGLSECSAATLRRAYAVHPISAIQVEYSPFSLDIESEQVGLLKVARELGVTVVAYSPLGRGFLTGQYKSRDDFEEGDFRKFAPRFSEENFPKNLELVHLLQEIGKKKGCSTGQVTLAWLLAQGPDVIPIPGTKKIKYLDDNFGALKVELTEADVSDIRAAIEKVEVKGERYPEGRGGQLYADTPAL